MMTTLAGGFKHPPTPPAILGNFAPLPSSEEAILHKRVRELQLAAPPITREDWVTVSIPGASLEDAA